MATSWRTASDRTVTVKSLSSLCLIVGNPLDEQFIAWSTANPLPQTHLGEDQQVTIHNEGTRHHKKPPCVRKTCVLQLGEQKARTKVFFHWTRLEYAED